MRPGTRAVSLGELIDALGGELSGERSLVVRQVAPLASAQPDQIAYLENDAYRDALRVTRAGAVVLRKGARRPSGAYIISAHPYAYFIRVAALLNPEPEMRPSVHALASIDPTASVDPSVQIGPFVSVGANAFVDARVRIDAGCRIGAHARIGADSRLHANVTIYDHCVVGRRVVLNAGCVIGADGFGGTMQDGRWLKMPHVGRAVLGDDVEIGANTTVDRGAMADTVIGDGAKLDNQIQVGHNVQIGAHTSIAGCTGIAGSARIGAYCVISGGARIIGHIQLADRVHVSVGTVVTRSILVPGRYSGIYPTSEHRAWLRGAVQVRRLGEKGQTAGRSRHEGGPESTKEETDDNANP